MNRFNTPKLVSVILPFYHETQEKLNVAIKRISEFFKKRNIPFEIIVSQNGQTKKLTLNEPKVRVVFVKNKGLGYAIKNAAEIASGDYIYFLSLEIPFNFTDLIRILKIHNQYDLIIGSKLHAKSVYKINRTRILTSFLINIIGQMLLPKYAVKDPNGTLFGRSDIFKRICSETKSNDFFFNTEFVYLYCRKGFKICEIPVTYVKTSKGSSVRFYDGINYLRQLVLLRLRMLYQY